jgi:hypothetical protein
VAEITDLGVAEIRDGFRGGEFSAREVADAYNTAIAEADTLNCFIVTTPEKAVEAAEEADRALASGDVAPLSGVPLGIKDLFCTNGVQSTAASHILEGFVPPYESTVSGKLLAAGAGMLGKLNMDQFAMGSSNETSHFGNVVSPSPIPVARSASRLHLPAFAELSRPMAAVRGSAWLPLLPRSIRRVRWRAASRIAPSCSKRWRDMTPGTRPRSMSPSPIGKRASAVT